MTSLSRAMLWAALGVPVFPVVNKRPMSGIVSWPREATTDAEQLADWFRPAWRAVVPALYLDAAGLCALDFDPPPDPADDWIAHVVGTWPPTFHQRTARGVHLIYRGHLPNKVRAASLGPNIDTRGRGGYVVAYADAPPTLDAFAPVPEHVVAALMRDPTPRRRPQTSGEPVTELRLLKLLCRLDPDMDYERWRNVVAAINATPLLGDESGERRWQIADEWSRGNYWRRRAQRYDADAVRQVLETMPPREGGVSFGTIVHMAQQTPPRRLASHYYNRRSNNGAVR